MAHELHELNLPASNPTITKTVLYPVPTEWMGDDYDPDEVGVATYRGPRYWLTYWEPGTNNSLIEYFEVGHKDCGRVPVQGSVMQVLDVEENPLHAMALFGYNHIEPPRQLEVAAGPSNVPNQTISDPYHFTEVFDMTSFYFDTENDRWSEPKFSSDTPDCVFPDDETVCFGWLNVRHVRNKMLEACDHEVANANVPAEVLQPWLDYRQALRDLPADWADVGNHTHLIVWPEMPAKTDGKLPDQNGEPDREGRRDLMFDQ